MIMKYRITNIIALYLSRYDNKSKEKEIYYITYDLSV